MILCFCDGFGPVELLGWSIAIFIAAAIAGCVIAGGIQIWEGWKRSRRDDP